MIARWAHEVLVSPDVVKDPEAFEETLLDAAPFDAAPGTATIVRYRVKIADSIESQLNFPMIRFYVEGTAVRP